MKDNEASSTAYTVLQGLLFVAQKPELSHLVSPRNRELGTHILQSSAQGRKRLNQINSAAGKILLPLMERLLLPSISLHYVLRKAYIEKKVREAIDAGATQIINLGAGFDTLLYRLAEENTQLNCIEIDHPATHQVKKQALTSEQLKLDNLHFLPVDFTHQTLQQELGQCSAFAPEKPTVCIVEGVLMYLTPEQIYSLLQSLLDLLDSSPRHLVFTAVEPASNHPESYGPLLKLYLKLKGEPLNWLCEENDLKAFIERSDFKLQETANSDVFRQYFMPDYPHRLHKGEYGAFAVSTSTGEA
ncbi:class I SAM-dependent methyltransferase [Planctobacterium marinum]|uniref:class I SAM-dependent methyltransferase n=1 Tax=Planctobacterium marinum TaxID=1631968 RepID=UPI001E338B16|nr:class I SAM-dependent methyltransferase [Planctobacterium marinum]MCC2604813.1 class I SAM-dependent methyltransferase [Planctobacterium marinum]